MRVFDLFRVVCCVVVLAAASVGLAAQIGAPDPVVGVFEGEGIRVEVERGPAGYRGTIVQGDRKFPFTAKAVGGTLEGKFSHGEHQYPFRARLDGDTMHFESGASKRKLSRHRPPVNPLDQPANPLADNPLADPKPPVPPVGPNATLPVLPLQPGWRQVKHPAGFQLQVPKAWTDQSRTGPQGSAMMVAPPVGSTPQEQANGPAVMVVIASGLLQGPLAAVQRPDDPNLLKMLVENPNLKTARPTRMVKLPSGSASVTDFSLANQGNTFQMRLHVFVWHGRFVSCLATSLAQTFATHQKTVETIAASLSLRVSKPGPPSGVIPSDPVGPVAPGPVAPGPVGPKPGGPITAQAIQGKWTNGQLVVVFQGNRVTIGPAQAPGEGDWGNFEIKGNVFVYYEAGDREDVERGKIEWQGSNLVLTSPDGERLVLRPAGAKPSKPPQGR